MQVLNHTQAAGAFRRVDIQVQSPTAKLGIVLNGVSDAKIRIRHISPSGGTKVLQDLISVSALLEASTFSEGFFIKEQTKIAGTFDLSEAGALDMKDGYLSIDLDTEAAVSLTSAAIYAIEAPVTTNKYLSYNPVYLNGGITREISLSGVQYILLPVAAVKTVDIDFASRSVSYDTQELKFIANDINDLVSVNTSTGGGSVYGYGVFIRLSVEEASRMTLTPTDSVPFYCYLIEERVL